MPKLTCAIEGVTYYLDLKERWCQRDVWDWKQAAALKEEDFASDDALREATRRINANKLALLTEWSTGCYLVDVEGREYHAIAELTPELMEGLDAPLYALIQDAAVEAFQERARLGGAKGRR